MTKYPAYLYAIVDKDKRQKLAQICLWIGTKEVEDKHIKDKNGKHPKVPMLSLLRYGVRGPTFDKLAEMLEVT